jgi:hypothetical protein
VDGAANGSKEPEATLPNCPVQRGKYSTKIISIYCIRCYKIRYMTVSIALLIIISLSLFLRTGQRFLHLAWPIWVIFGSLIPMVFAPIVPISHFAFAVAAESTARMFLLAASIIYGAAVFRMFRATPRPDIVQWCFIAGCAAWFGVAYAFTEYEISGPTPDVYRHPAYILNWLVCTSMAAISLFALWARNIGGATHRVIIMAAALFLTAVFLAGVSG